MIIETILVILGILTTVLGIWNIIIGAYIWGGLFLIGGIWAIGLGSIYINELRKERKKINSTKGSLNSSSIEIFGQNDSMTIPDEGIQVESLFEEPVVRPQSEEVKEEPIEVKEQTQTVAVQTNPSKEVVTESVSDQATKSSKGVEKELEEKKTENKPITQQVDDVVILTGPIDKLENESVIEESLESTTETKKAENVQAEQSPIEIPSPKKTEEEVESAEQVNPEIDAMNIVLIDENIDSNDTQNRKATDEEIRDFEAKTEKIEESTDEEKTDQSKKDELLEELEKKPSIEEESIDYVAVAASTNQLVSQDEGSMSLMITEVSVKEEKE